MTWRLLRWIVNAAALVGGWRLGLWIAGRFLGRDEGGGHGPAPAPARSPSASPAAAEPDAARAG